MVATFNPADMLPQLIVVVELPEMISEDARARVNRIHGQAAKAAMRDVLESFLVERFKMHFRTSARAEYDHFRRAPSTLKRKGRKPDLVRSGRSRGHFLMRHGWKVSVGGRVEAGELRGRATKMWPRHVKVRKHSPQHVSRAKMAIELSRFSTEDAEWIRLAYRAAYVAHMQAALKPRMRKRLESRLTSLGI